MRAMRMSDYDDHLDNYGDPGPFSVCPKCEATTTTVYDGKCAMCEYWPEGTGSKHPFHNPYRGQA